MRRHAAVMGAALLASVAAAGVSGSAVAQPVAALTVVPAAADPGSTVTVANAPTSPCPPPAGAGNPSASVDLFAIGSATPVNRTPYQGRVSPTGIWSVDVRLAADLPPGTYRVQAGCYTDSGLNSGFGPAYTAGRLEVRLLDPGRPTPSVERGRPGDSIQVASGEARCTPPAGAPSPRVRVSLLDATKATRAEAEGPVDPRTGRWSVDLRVPTLSAQNVEITAVCLARVGAPSPYARYKAASFAVEAGVQPGVTVTTAGPATTAAPGASTTAASPEAPAPAASFPSTPIAVPIIAEPTYTG